MKNTIAGATFVLLGAGVAAVGAQLPNLRGSDTLEDVARFMLTPAASPFCPNTQPLAYFGGGSTGGEQAMTGTGAAAPLNNPIQSVSPMSRALGAAVCTTKQGNPGTAAGMFICLDGIAIVTGTGHSAPAASCDIKFASGNDWRDVLRMVYAGAGPGDATVARDCARAERVALVNNWGSMFNAPCVGTSNCQQLRHAFRRADLSGTTDTFLSLLALPAATANPFCNGVGLTTPLDGLNVTSDFSDNDPIRRKCAIGGAAGNEEVCNRAGLPSSDPNSNTLGVVLPVFVPENLTQPQAYPLPTCTFGRFAVVSNPTGVPCAYSPVGPNPAVACLVPYEELPGGVRNFACTNTRTNRGFYLGTTLGDGRSYNQVLRRADSGILRDANNRRLIGSYYRLHQTQVLAGGVGQGPGTRVCQEMTATRQIGCLTAANTCSIGFAGREATELTATIGLRLRGRPPNVPDIQNLILDAANSYPFSRKLYFNSVVAQDITGSHWGQPGTAANKTAQQNLWNCFTNAAQVKTACETFRFVEVPAQGATPAGPRCEDFNEATACTAWTGAPRNACLPLAAHCSNNVQDADETGVDVGGADCPIVGGGVTAM